MPIRAIAKLPVSNPFPTLEYRRLVPKNPQRVKSAWGQLKTYTSTQEKVSSKPHQRQKH